MNNGLNERDREALRTELLQVFDARTTEILLNVLDKVTGQIRAVGVTREDFSELKEIVAELATAQRRTEEQVRVLAEAQAKTEERVGRLELAVERLAEAQTRTEAALQQLARQVGGLSETVGGDIED
ncbi:MAG: hypothetical protein HY731_15745, partial [Candidatus Tectomicrobia bacterium]|nr:hypothetical protein [Candidatus Tectomicrobia bacterium]